jgi:hypothetical protein
MIAANGFSSVVYTCMYYELVQLKARVGGCYEQERMLKRLVSEL